MSFLDRWQKRAKRIITIIVIASLAFLLVLGFKIETLFIIVNQWWITFSNLIPDHDAISFIFPFRIKLFKENVTLAKYEKTLKRNQITLIIVTFIGLIIFFGYAFKLQVLYNFLTNLGEVWIEVIFYLSIICSFGCFYFSPQYIWSKAMSISTLSPELRKSIAYTSAYYQIYVGFVLRNGFSGIMSIFGIGWFNELYSNLMLGATLSFLFYVISVELPYWYGSSLHKKDKLKQLKDEKNGLLAKKDEENDPLTKVYYLLEVSRLDQELSGVKNESVHLHKGVLMIPVILAGVIVNVVLTEILKGVLLP